MKKKNSIKISGDNKEVLSITLGDVLSSIVVPNNVKWAVIWIHAIGNLGIDESILEFEDRINNSLCGVIYNLEDLKILAQKLDQTLEFVLIGDEDLKKLKRYDDDEEMYSSCHYTIELVDSTYWLIHSNDDDFIKLLANTLPGVELNDE